MHGLEAPGSAPNIADGDATELSLSGGWLKKKKPRMSMLTPLQMRGLACSCDFAGADDRF